MTGSEKKLIWEIIYKELGLLSCEVANSQMSSSTIKHLALNFTYIFASLELVDVNVDDLSGRERLLQRVVVRVVFGRGVPQLPEQQRVLHDPLDRFDD